MKKQIRLNESSLRTMIKEAIVGILNEDKEEFDWDWFNEYPNAREVDMDYDWNVKNARDKEALRRTVPDTFKDDFDDLELDKNNRGYLRDEESGYDSGYDEAYGDRDISDDYFSDSDYRFSHDEWADDDFFGPVNNVDRMYDPNSDINRRFTKNESKIRRIVRESLLKEAYSDKLSYMTDALDYYANMVDSGKPLSQDQLSHVQEIYDFLYDTNSHDNYEVMTYWMPLAQNLLNGNDPGSGLNYIVRESINRVLKENADYEGMDLTDQDSLIMQAEDAIYRLESRGEDYGWRQVAEEMGFRINTLNGDDIENLRDAIELAMASGSV